jgi:antitoxin component YwqK of YwqJK toxin-antitoxin module
MKTKTTLILFIVFSYTILPVFGQKSLPVNGFTNKSEARNILKDTIKEGKWIEYFDNEGNPTTDNQWPDYTLTIYKHGKPYGIVRKYSDGKLSDMIPYKDGKINGLEKIYDDDGHLQCERPYTNGKTNGIEKWYYPNGKIQSENSYVNDLANGVWKDYYINGKIKRITPFENDKMNGIVKGFDTLGNVECEATVINDSVLNGTITADRDDGLTEIPYVNGRKNGVLKVYFNYGGIRRELPFTNDTLNGIVKEYYFLPPFGKLKIERLKSETIYVKGEGGTTINYDINGNEINSFTSKDSAKNKLINGKKEGKWLEYSDYYGHVIVDSNAPSYKLTVYKNDRPDGIVRQFYKSGKRQQITPYLNGKRNGVERGYYENGRMFTEVTYVNGVLNGPWKEYFVSGKLKSNTPYTDGKINGVDTLYYESGKLRAEHPYTYSVRNGTSKIYYENGNLKSTTVYNNGVKGETINYDENGKEIK